MKTWHIVQFCSVWTFGLICWTRARVHWSNCNCRCDSFLMWRVIMDSWTVGWLFFREKWAEWTLNELESKEMKMMRGLVMIGESQLLRQQLVWPPNISAALEEVLLLVWGTAVPETSLQEWVHLSLSPSHTNTLVHTQAPEGWHFVFSFGADIQYL